MGGSYVQGETEGGEDLGIGVTIECFQDEGKVPVVID